MLHRGEIFVPLQLEYNDEQLSKGHEFSWKGEQPIFYIWSFQVKLLD